MPTEKISINVVWIVLILMFGIAAIVSDVVRTPETQAIGRCNEACGLHGVQSYTPTTGCLCRD